MKANKFVDFSRQPAGAEPVTDAAESAESDINVGTRSVAASLSRTALLRRRAARAPRMHAMRFSHRTQP